MKLAYILAIMIAMPASSALAVASHCDVSGDGFVW
jgi:hypothetical protein